MILFMNLLYAVFALGVIGGLIGLGLAVAGESPESGKKEKLDKIRKMLPGLNCGICGRPSCAAYGEDLLAGGASFDLCTPGGENVEKNLAKLMGHEVSLNYTEESPVPQVHCRGGGTTAAYLFRYKGLDDCSALHLLFGGDKVCKYSCLGLGSCIKVCPSSAIFFDDEGLVWVDKNRCTACGKCIEVCPTGVLRRIPRSADYIVACNSTETGPVTAEQCSVGCTACRACERRSPEGGFWVEKHLARINYRRRGERLNAVEACPVKCIIKSGTAKSKDEVSEMETYAKT